MDKTCDRLIRELHVFIAAWLKGTVAKTAQSFQAFEKELDDDFVIIHPRAVVQDKSAIVSDLWHAHGAQSEDFDIEIFHINTRFVSTRLCIMTYEEHQTGAKASVRLSTVVFRRPNGEEPFRWFHLHETWCAGAGQNP